MNGLLACAWGNQCRGGRSRYTAESLAELREVVFSNGINTDIMVRKLTERDLENLQQSCQQFNRLVIWNNGFFDARRIVITKDNAMEIVNHPPLRVWMNAKLVLEDGKGILGREEFQALRFLWEELKDLKAINQSVKSLDRDVTLKESVMNFSSSLVRDLLFHAGNLTRLVVSADVLCSSTVDDLNNLDKGPWTKLNYFEIKVTADSPEKIWWIVQECDYSSFVHGYSTASARYMEFLSILNWEKLETFKLDTVEDITLSVVSCNLLKNVRNLDLNGFPSSNCEDTLWARMKRFEMLHLKELTTTVVSSDSEIHSDLRTFLEKQPHLTSIHLRVKYLKEELFGANESRIGAYPWKKLRIEFHSTENVPLSFGLFTQLDKLESFAFGGSKSYHRNNALKPSMEEVIDLLPSTGTMTHLSLSLCSAMHSEGQHLRMMAKEFERRSRSKFPNLRQCSINLLSNCEDCIILGGMQFGRNFRVFNEQCMANVNRRIHNLEFQLVELDRAVRERFMLFRDRLLPPAPAFQELDEDE